jgi:preprotein translocase subunit SecA
MLKADVDSQNIEVGGEKYLEVEASINASLKGERETVLNAGGLYVIGTERHESRRIDNQLRGRSGRQGDPGRSRFFLSLDDPLMRRFYRDWVKNFLSKAGMGDGEPVESKMVSNAIKKAQKKVEDYHFEIRKSLLEYDEVMNEQRKMIYTQRQSALAGESLSERVLDMAREAVRVNLENNLGDGNEVEPEWELIKTFIDRRWDSTLSIEDLQESGVNQVVGHVTEDFETHYSARSEQLGEEQMSRLESFLVLNAIDTKWKEHLYVMDALRSGIGLRGYAQVDPKNEYKREGLERFEEMLLNVAEEVSSFVLRVQLKSEMDQKSEVYAGQQASHPSFGGNASQTSASGGRPAQPQRQVAVGYEKSARTPQQPGAPAATAPASPKPKVARNAPCPCGSGKKYKQCHGKQ